MSKTVALLWYQNLLDRVTAETASAKELGPERAEAVLIAASQLLGQALNECQKSLVEKTYQTNVSLPLKAVTVERRG